MTGIVWRWTLNGQFGMLNALLIGLGLIGQPIEFLATGEVAFPVAILIGILAAVPLTVVIFLGAFSSLPSDVFDAAVIDGAGPLARFRYMTLPLIRPFINIAVVLNVIYAFNSFAIIWVLTQGGPANSTDILVTYLYKVAFQYGKLAEASAMSLMMFAFLLVCLHALRALRHSRAGLVRTSALTRGAKDGCVLAAPVAFACADIAALCGDAVDGAEVGRRSLHLPAALAAGEDRFFQLHRHLGEDRLRTRLAEQPLCQHRRDYSHPRDWPYRPPMRWPATPCREKVRCGSSFC